MYNSKKKSALKKNQQTDWNSFLWRLLKMGHRTIKEGAAIMLWSLTKSLITSAGPLKEKKIKYKNLHKKFSLLKLATWWNWGTP